MPRRSLRACRHIRRQPVRAAARACSICGRRGSLRQAVSSRVATQACTAHSSLSTGGLRKKCSGEGSICHLQSLTQVAKARDNRMRVLLQRRSVLQQNACKHAKGEQHSRGRG